MSASRKGDRRERQLVNLLDKHEFAVIRAPASGSATERELPDVLAGNGDEFYAIESKASSGDPIYIDSEEIENLEYFAGQFGAKPVVVVRFDLKTGDPAHSNKDRSGYYLFKISELYETPSGNKRVKKETAIADGTPIEDIFPESVTA